MVIVHHLSTKPDFKRSEPLVCPASKAGRGLNFFSVCSVSEEAHAKSIITQSANRCLLKKKKKKKLNMLCQGRFECSESVCSREMLLWLPQTAHLRVCFNGKNKTKQKNLFLVPGAALLSASTLSLQTYITHPKFHKHFRLCFLKVWVHRKKIETLMWLSVWYHCLARGLTVVTWLWPLVHKIA